MSGHSKWSTIKRKKGAKDAERGKLFTKLIKEITVSARSGGDESGNPRLRTAILNARAANMPNATIERAVRRGTGEEPGVIYEEVLYEGYGPGGVAVIVEGLTDNKNRTVSEVRHIFSKHNGNLAENGSVAWMFAQKGVIEVDKNAIGEEELMMLVLDAGAEDLQDGGEVHEIVAPLVGFEAVKQVIEEKGLSGQAALAWLPQNMLAVESRVVEPIINLLEALEDLDDVQKVYSNFDAPEAELQKLLESA
ncbi:MAG: YebC/PmpR family DNA-binding transcriptional regulator [Candidatus Handelsmanbacteria bacterium]|nr:YebC/PmpR family DNA-binding transcriptional regulator [Candidatus Handelsmanbacteria bacterium]